MVLHQAWQTIAPELVLRYNLITQIDGETNKRIAVYAILESAQTQRFHRIVDIVEQTNCSNIFDYLF